MKTNLQPDSCPNTILPPSIIGFEVAPPTNTKSDFIVDLSHEIRTPIGAIIGLSRVLLSTILDDKQRQYVTVLQNSAEELLAMIERTLDASKINSKIVDLKNGPFDMTLLLEQITGIMSVKAQEKSIGLTLNYEADFHEIFVGDSGRIRQIVTNLVGNAVKFTDTGDVTVTLASNGTVNGKEQISISVADTGIGIAADKIGVIFDRFVQADSSISHKYGGTGLGLSISKVLAENMGGSISVASVAGEGSEFVLYLQLPTEAISGEMLGLKNIVYLDAAINAKKTSFTGRDR